MMWVAAEAKLSSSTIPYGIALSTVPARHLMQHSPTEKKAQMNVLNLIDNCLKEI
jgi:hypothetical protein